VNGVNPNDSPVGLIGAAMLGFAALTPTYGHEQALKGGTARPEAWLRGGPRLSGETLRQKA